MRALATFLVTFLVLTFFVDVSAGASPVTGDYLRLPGDAAVRIRSEARSRANGEKGWPTFVKVGDSNTVTHRALYGLGCYRFTPIGLRPSLMRVIRRYRQKRVPVGRKDLPGASCNKSARANSFSRVSLASRGGTKFGFALEAGSIFDLPCVADVLTCEIEEVRPRYAFIQFGTNEALFSVESEMTSQELGEVRTELTAIVSTTRSLGVTPVVITAPVAIDSSLWVPGVPGRVVAINEVIRDIAQSQGVPMIDLWLAQKKEIGPSRGYGLDSGGVHLSSPSREGRWTGTTNLSPRNRSRFGMNLRSYLIVDALEKLDGILTSKRVLRGR